MVRRVWVLALLMMLGFTLPATRTVQAATEDEYFELMKLFVDTFEEIDRNFVEPVDRRELIEAAMRGMVLKLDPHSNYIGTSEIRQFTEAVDQEFGGIGIQVTIEPKTRRLMVMVPMPGTPAIKAGLRAGDHILEIDDKPTADFPAGREMESAVQMMRGKPGETVKVKIQHTGAPMPETVEIVRDVIKSPTVMGDHYDSTGNWSFLIEGEDKLGYIRLTNFARNSTEEVHSALEALKKEGMKGLVLDLRFNPGGLLGAATAISDFFVESGVIVSVKGRNTEEQTYKATKRGTYSGFPMVVLVNHSSASASEIVSACLQDHKRAVIVGERSYGKGSVQNVIQLEGGKSALKLTTASYHRPSGKNIHRLPKATEKDEWGVVPDPGFEVKLTDEDLEKMIIARRERDLNRNGEPSKGEYIDPQLAKGIAYLKEQLSQAKPDADKPANGEKDKDKADVKPEPKPEPKTDGAAVQHPLQRQFVDAILELLPKLPARATTIL